MSKSFSMPFPFFSEKWKIIKLINVYLQFKLVWNDKIASIKFPFQNILTAYATSKTLVQFGHP